jgi:hypothetical protein
MSHLTTIRTEIKDQGVLLEALAGMNCMVRKDCLVGEQYRKTKVDFAVEAYWGFRRKACDGSFEAVGIAAHLRSRGTQRLIKRIHQEYARLKTLKEARKQGFALVQEQVLQNGAIKLVLRKINTAVC